MIPQKIRLFKEIVDNEIKTYVYVSEDHLKQWLEKNGKFPACKLIRIDEIIKFLNE